MGMGLGQSIFHGPAAHLRAVNLYIQKTGCFAGGETVGGGWTTGEPFAQQLDKLLRPGGAVIAAGDTGQPLILLTARAGAQIARVKLIETALGKVQLLAGLQRFQGSGTKLGEDVADQRRRTTMGQLKFFIAAQDTAAWPKRTNGFFALEQIPV
ncbi:MAG TPA: hypothetical protein VM680_08025 [Verrucomicrobiae bacterium]|nr:hypothetical protein [Verrucomicrobiae bacterium]